jgi:molybdenum cofactor cytidylyltransferase
MPSRPAVIVLAAGKGSRFAASERKLIQPLGDSTVLESTLGHAIATGLPVVVVTVAALADTARRFVASRDLVVLPEAGSAGQHSLGIGYSISAGVSNRPDARGWLIMPGDMPLVRTSTIQRVAAELDNHPIAFAQYRGRRGHPVGFSAELYSELVVLSGDEGARRLVSRYPAYGVEADDPGVLLDVDTRADLARLREIQPAELAAELVAPPVLAR